MSKRTEPPAAGDFDPVPVRPRVDGWTPERQTGFIEALAATGNVEAAAKAVGMGTTSAYMLRARPDAASFREAWGIALDCAVQRLADAALDRAINGVATPIFYKGEQIGERRRFDEKLTMFILRLRDPKRFGKWREDRVPSFHQDGAAMLLQVAMNRVENDAHDMEAGVTPPRHKPLPELRLITLEQEEAVTILRGEHLAAIQRRREYERCYAAD
ncbi:hypothetical protein ACLN6N_10025 [Sphingomonas carotinifaciens]|uniref:hypothetical protein n=1 Tax=Sphingomonas TaxID=13687 RepID=UPI000DDBC54C|nr:hypothetical protein [Sphingomonas carotinifaciens]